jgi:hypothetical protein
LLQPVGAHVGREIGHQNLQEEPAPPVADGEDERDREPDEPLTA